MPIPDDIKRFIAEKINSVEQLEVLLLLRAEPARTWTATAVSEAISSSAAAAALRLADLHAVGLLRSSADALPAYNYHASSSDQDALVARLAEAYRERRVAVIAQIYARPLDQAQAFADAFCFRKDR